MAQVLKNKALDEKLAYDGFAVIQFLDKSKVDELLSFYFQFHNNDIPGFYASVFSENIPLRQEITQKIKSIYMPIVEEHFINHKLIGGIFIVKTEKEKERLHPHQDWGFIDEDKYRAFNIWVPLVDVNEENGAMRVTAKSHLWSKNYRGPKIPDTFTNKQEEIWQNMQTMNLKAGEALIYDARLFHASFPNQTTSQRIATVFGAIPNDVPMIHYVGDNEYVDVYESNEDFFLGSNINKGAEVLKKIGRVKMTADINKNIPSYMKNNTANNDPWFKRLFGIKSH